MRLMGKDYLQTNIATNRCVSGVSSVRFLLMTSTLEHPDRPIDVRLKIAALWTATMLIFAYVDLFSLYRADMRADIEAGKISAFEIGQPFLFFTTLYVIVPAVMIYLSLVLRRRVNRIINIVLAAFYGLTIIGAAIGEWNYYVLGSVVEVGLLIALARHAWTWPEPQVQGGVPGSDPTASRSRIERG